MPNDRTIRQVRSVPQKFETRAGEAGDLYISGYFAVFGSDYEIWDGATESIDPAAFNATMGDDIRALINHDTRLVLGRNTAGTLKLSVDSKGLYGDVQINPSDQDAMNLYERVKRGDVDQCSIGFDILEEDYTENLEAGTCHWTIKRVKLWEVSVVTFPAYEETSVKARRRDQETIRQREFENWKSGMLEKLKGAN